MNVLIIGTNRSRQPFPVMPLGACIVAEAAEQAGHNVRLLDLMFCRNPVHALECELSRATPDLVGLSLRNIDNNDMHHPIAFFKDVLRLIDAICRRTEVPIVLGGPAVAVMPEALLRYTGTKWAVPGNGEVVFPRLLETISRGDDPKRIPGIASLEDAVFKKNSSPGTQFRDSPLVPDFHRWLNVRAYVSGLSTVPIQSKRGCPYECVYCTYPMGEGNYYRLCAPERVVNAINRLAYQEIHDIEFVDNVFNAPYDHAIAICEGIARKQLRIRLHTMELNPRFIDDELLSAMERAGFVSVGITAESASDGVLEGLRKGFTAEHVRRAAKAVQRHNIPSLWMFMLGAPEETKETVQETLNFAAQYIRPTDVAFFNVGIRIYPGTKLESLARTQGVLSRSSTEMLEPAFYFSPSLDMDWLNKKLCTAMHEHMNYINIDSIGLPFLTLMNRLGYRFGMRPPLWRHTRAIRRGLRLFGVD